MGYHFKAHYLYYQPFNYYVYSCSFIMIKIHIYHDKSFFEGKKNGLQKKSSILFNVKQLTIDPTTEYHSRTPEVAKSVAGESKKP